MATKPAAKSTGKPNAAEILNRFKKDYGEEIGGLGAKYVNLPRLPFDIFPLDLSLGGGIPMGKMTEIFGPESSNKTNKVLKLIKVGQMLWPKKKAVFVDCERSFDPVWAKRMGCDVDRIIVMEPEYAEQAVDIVEGFLYAPDVFLVALDSIAALITSNEIASSAEKAVVGGSSNVVGRLIRKGVLALGEARKANPDHFAPAFVCINQIRHKIGVMFGDPETTPGGNAPRFAAACRIRVYGKNIIDKKISEAMPAQKEVSCIIRKWKFPILQVNATYTMQMLEHAGKGAGHVEDWNTIFAYLKELDYISKGPAGGWKAFGDPFKTIEDIKQSLYSDPSLLLQAKQTIIAEMTDKGTLEESDGEIFVDEGSPADIPEQE